MAEYVGNGWKEVYTIMGVSTDLNPSPNGFDLEDRVEPRKERLFL